MADPICRVVVTSESGESAIESAGMPPAVVGDIEGYGPMLATIWEYRGPSDFGDPAEGAPHHPGPGVARFQRLIFKGGWGVDDPGMHRTQTTDVAYIVEGQVELVLEKESRVLTAGDFVVLRGDLHGWRNDTDQPCVIVSAMFGTDPVPDNG